MNKRIIAVAVAVVLTATLAGCMPVQNTNQPSGEDTTQAQTQQTQEQSGTASANPFNRPQAGQQTQEPESVDLTVSVEGGMKTVKATVYTGSGYTIAVPEGWERTDREPQWSPIVNDDVELTVRFYSGKKADAVSELFRRDERDYTFETPTQTSLAHVDQVTELRGSEMDDGEITDLVAYFVDTDAGCYGILLECPAEAAEGFGGYLGAMANSFALTAETK